MGANSAKRARIKHSKKKTKVANRIKRKVKNKD